jgi:hypothetical protein
MFVNTQNNSSGKRVCTVTYLVKARTVKLQKQPLIDNGYVTRNNGVTVESGVFCAVRAEAI